MELQTKNLTGTVETESSREEIEREMSNSA